MKTNLTPEQRKELTKLLVNGLRPSAAAKQIGVTASTAGSLRARLIQAGAVTRFRSKRTTKKTTTKTQRVTDQLTNTLSSTTPYKFVVGGTQITVNKAKELNFFSDRVEINF